MTNYKIEKGIPMPMKKGGADARDVIEKMETGDSVFFESRSPMQIFYNHARKYGMVNGKKFSSRTVEGGYRIWRTQ